MPQKKNPDSVELVRAKSGRVIILVNLLIIQKGLPSVIAKIFRGKEPVFNAYDTIEQDDDRSSRKNKDKWKKCMNYRFGRIYNSNWFSRLDGKKFKDFFREAHEKTGQLILIAESKKTYLHHLDMKHLSQLNQE